MITPEDIKLLIAAEREVFATKDDIGEVLSSVNTLTTSVDAYCKKTDTYHQEMAVLLYKVQRMEDWIVKVSQKIGVNYA